MNTGTNVECSRWKRNHTHNSHPDGVMSGRIYLPLRCTSNQVNTEKKLPETQAEREIWGGKASDSHSCIQKPFFQHPLRVDDRNHRLSFPSPGSIGRPCTPYKQPKTNRPSNPSWVEVDHPALPLHSRDCKITLVSECQSKIGVSTTTFRHRAEQEIWGTVARYLYMPKSLLDLFLS